jgi:simple sugar transport system permease protein
MNETGRRWSDRLFDIVPQIVALVAALLIGALMLLALGVNPFDAYRAAFIGVFATKNGLSDMLVKATPLLLVALGICIAFRANVINIGAEGQLIMGALATTWVAIAVGNSLPALLVILAAALAGTLAGGFWGAIPGYLKARLSVNEILSTVMLNQIAIQFGFFLLRGPMMDPAERAAGTNLPHSARLPAAADLARFTDVAKSAGLNETAKQRGLEGMSAELYGLFVEPTRLHLGLIVALIMAVLVYIFLWRTTLGYRIRAVGLNPHAARYAGFNVRGAIVLALTLSGAFAGLAGAVEVLGLHHRMFEPTAVSAGYGFAGIVAALFGKLHPLGAIPSSLLFGALLVGGDKMQRAMQIPQPLVTALLGLIVLFVVSADYWTRRRAARVPARAEPAAAPGPASAQAAD